MSRLLTAMAASLFLLPFVPPAARAQALTLDDCIQLAYQHLEYEQQTRAYDESSGLAVKNAGKSWLPTIAVDGTYSRQNENVEIPVQLPIPGPGIPDAPLEFSRVLVNFTQNIYDGSVSAARRNLERSKYNILAKQIEVEKAQTKSRVISLYMSIHLTDENLSILGSKRKVIAARTKALEKAAEFGGASIANIKTLDAELLMTEQKIIELQHTRMSLTTSLGQMIGRDLDETQQLTLPDPEVVVNDSVDDRPEIQLLDARIENLDFQKAMAGTFLRPRLSAFASVGAGDPGYNIYNEDVAMMSTVGVQLHWNLFDWNHTRNQKKILAADQAVVRSDRVQARVTLQTELKRQERDMEMYEALLAKDEELVRLRTDVTAIRVAELENGTITSTDYIAALDLEEEARLNQKIHQLRLILARLNYLTVQGN